MNRSIARVLASSTLAALVLVGVAEARNPHCAGGIQYVVQGMRDKLKENYDDYRRQMNKAVQQLEQCASEDPADLEALGYLGWAYAELDSAGPAGKAFAKAIAGLEPKDPKKAELVKTNRDSYWTTAFNDGIDKINKAQTAYPEYLKKPESPAEETAKAEAGRLYGQAILAFTRASLIKSDPRTLRNMGSVYAFRGEYQPAEAVFIEGLRVAPDDADLKSSLAAVRTNFANQLIDEQKFDEAIGYYGDLLKSDPDNGDLNLGAADAYFKRAQKKEGDARKPDFKAAGEHYAKAGAVKNDNADLPFNAALAFGNAGEHSAAEAQWRAALRLRPHDPDALSALGATLAELKKMDDAIRAVHQAVLADPKNKARHRQLGAIYTKAENNPKATEELMVYLALQNGKVAGDTGERSKSGEAGAAGAKVLTASGAPEQIYSWEADGQKYDTWFYWTKHQAYHFKAATLTQKSDWSAPDVKAAGSSAGKK